MNTLKQPKQQRGRATPNKRMTSQQLKQADLQKAKVEKQRAADALAQLKPTQNMAHLKAETERQVNDMLPEEVEHHQKVDAVHRHLQNYQFETQLREIVSECMAPLRNR